MWQIRLQAGERVESFDLPAKDKPSAVALAMWLGRLMPGLERAMVACGAETALVVP
jgi:TM2 domain-containing membrane protein YozV